MEVSLPLSSRGTAMPLLFRTEVGDKGGDYCSHATEQGSAILDLPRTTTGEAKNLDQNPAHFFSL